MKGKRVLVDHDILGWGNQRSAELLKQYEKVLKVGSELGLERRKPDTIIASYCKENDCDLLTGDVRAYQHFFDVGVKAVQVSRYAWIAEPTDKAVFLVQIAEKE